MTTNKDKYQLLSPIEHVLLRPNTYVGSVKNEKSMEYIYNNRSKSIVCKEISFNCGFERLFEEILLNAYDHFREVKHKTNRVSKISVVIDTNENYIEIKNNGEGIPVRNHQKHQILIPEMVFTKLNSSSNYDDNIDRKKAGVNGLGAKLTVILSKEFRLETVDSIRKKKFTMVVKNNLLEGIEKKKVIDYKGGSYTKVRYYPDLERFKLKKISKDMVDYMRRRCYDTVACCYDDNTKTKVKLSFNNEPIEIKTFKDYIKLYFDNLDNKDIFYETINNEWQFGVVINEDDNFNHVSFVNGIYTSEGGTHVKRITDQLVKAIKTKLKGTKISDSNIRNKLNVFVCCVVNRPEFSSQSKTKLKTPIKEFTNESKISTTFINKLLKSSIIKDLKSLDKHKQSKSLEKKNGRKVARLKNPNKNFDDALQAGKKDSIKCKLFLTEGLSAKGFVSKGFKIIKNKHYGVYPLKGKVINAQAKSDLAVSKNKELMELQEYIGLQHKCVYYDDISGKPKNVKKGYTVKHLKTLRYGGIIGLTDEDYDGYHIKGLLINWIHTYWPELLALGFFYSFKTPIVRAKKGKELIDFYTLRQYENWKKTNDLKKWNIKYFKGLGSWNKTDTPELFKQFDKYLIRYFYDVNAEDSIHLAFHNNKKYINQRKKWLKKYDENAEIIDYTKLINRNKFIKVNITDFINLELKQFSHYDIKRSIPSVVDGFKPTQRKILFGMFDKSMKNVNINKTIKVGILMGHISKVSAYHHGEKSIYTTICNMAYDFCGKNNINLLFPDGEFGTKHNSACGSERYVFTALMNITKKIFREEDLNILEYLNEEGMKIEPKYYVPIIPMVLINGAIGIGTGYSTNVPSFNPMEIIDLLIDRLEGKKDLEYNLLPYYKDFDGEIEEYEEEDKEDRKTWYFKGNYEIDRTNYRIKITEIPPKFTTTEYKHKFLDSIEKYNKRNKTEVIVGIDDTLNVNKPELELVFNETTEDTKKYFRELIKSDELHKDIKLIDSEKSTNMNLFNPEGNLNLYSNIKEMIDDFFYVRYNYYEKRKEYLLNELEKKLLLISNKVRFIEYVNNEKIIIFKRKKKDIEQDLQKNKFDKINDNYDYLINMRISVLTIENANKLKNEKKDIEEEIDYIKETSIEDMWIDELEELKDELKGFD